MPGRRHPLALLLAISCGALAGCSGEEPAVPLAAFRPVQIDDRGVTPLISAPDRIGLDLLVEGWTVEASEDPPASRLVMHERKGRLFFYSPDASVEAVEAMFADDTEGDGMRLVEYCLNGESLGSLALFPGHPGFRLDFAEGTVRRGRNVLDLAISNERGRGKVAPLELSQLTFLPRFEGESVEAISPRRDADQDLWLQAGTVFEAAFTVPAGVRLEGRLEASRFASEGPMTLAIHLVDDTGSETTLLEQALGAGEGAEVAAPLDAWADQLVALYIEVDGATDGLVRFRDPELRGARVEELRPFSLLTRPEPPENSGELGRSDVVIVLLDAARADAYSPWGGPHPTPAIERLTQAGTRFARGLSPSSWTGQSVPAIFTGLFPDTLGIGSWGDSLGESMPTLAEAFSAAGYRTALWSQHPLYKHRGGLTRGFDQIFVAPKAERDQLPAREQLLDPERPTFAFVHFLPPHAPYDAPEPFAGTISAGYDGEFDPAPEVLSQFPHRRDPSELSPADLQYVRDRYQEKVVYSDTLVGHVVEVLERAGRYEDALVAVIADHGEAFLEHGRFLHTRHIYTQLVHVPFVVKWPASTEGFRADVAETVNLTDLMPTLVDGLGLPVEDGLQGRSLLPNVFARPLPGRAVYTMTSGVHKPAQPSKRQLRLELDGWSLIYDPQADRAELFRLEDDPQEQNDLAAQRPALALLLKQEVLMQHLFNRSLLESAQGLEEVEADMAKELEALGYL